MAQILTLFSEKYDLDVGGLEKICRSPLEKREEPPPETKASTNLKWSLGLPFTSHYVFRLYCVTLRF